MEQRIEAILSGSRPVAVVGISDKPERPSHGVAKYLQERGYRVIPVNPILTEVLGEKAYKSLAEIPGRVDLVDVFRRAELIPQHVEDILAMRPRPKVVWFQLGIKHEDSARILEAGGITVVQNRCTLPDHQRLGLGAPARR